MTETINGIVYVTAEEIRLMDEAATSDYGLDVLQLMENAGSSAAALARIILAGDVEGKRVLVLAGKGNKGGDGMVAARHIQNFGAGVKVVLAAGRDGLGDLAARQLDVLDKTGVPITNKIPEDPAPDLIVDALLGYSTRGAPRPPVSGAITKANASGAPILALDLPSGLDPTTGTVYEPCIEARATITFGLPKTGLLNPSARSVVGELYLADVSIPAVVYRAVGQARPLFSEGPLVRIW